MSDLVLHELTGSPNSVKARIALGYKGLAYERVPLEMKAFPGDRAALVSLSRQPRTPVLVHGKTVVFDSGGILRYLEANFPGTPPLFTGDYQEFGEIERWELFARTQLGEPIGLVFGQAFAPAADEKVLVRARDLLSQATGALEDRLAGHEFLVTDHLSAADVVCAAPLYLTDLSAKSTEGQPISAFFAAHLPLGEDRPLTRAWLRRVLAHDPICGQR
ncbi:MAG: glutathione S-transferase family protein [Planctomycetota bacterium]